ncbi:hypothetical protein DRO21_05400 [archaeon]|nr:MAG: hypothetical protein DRO21_05400 [archaeon]HDM23402.1 HAD family hydrolase [Candidatus Bathyarchaeota archaeon]
MFEGAILDFNGTLVNDHEQEIVKGICRIVARAHSVDLSKLVGTWNKTWVEILNEIASGKMKYLNLNDVGYFSLLKALELCGIDECKTYKRQIKFLTGTFFSYMVVRRSEMFPDALKFLEEIKSMGLKTVIISTSSKALIDAILKKHDVYKYIDEIVGSDVVKAYKPDYRVLKRAVEAIGSKNVIVIGDSYREDIAPAVEVGLEAVLLKRGKTLSSPARKGNYWIVCNLLQALEIVKG